MRSEWVITKESSTWAFFLTPDWPFWEPLWGYGRYKKGAPKPLAPYYFASPLKWLLNGGPRTAPGLGILMMDEPDQGCHKGHDE